MKKILYFFRNFGLRFEGLLARDFQPMVRRAVKSFHKNKRWLSDRHLIDLYVATQEWLESYRQELQELLKQEIAEGTQNDVRSIQRDIYTFWAPAAEEVLIEIRYRGLEDAIATRYPDLAKIMEEREQVTTKA